MLLWFGSCAVVVVVWNGRMSNERSFEQLIEDSSGGVNAEAAIGRLREKVLQGVRAIRAQANREDRAGSLARTALGHIAKEVNR